MSDWYTELCAPFAEGETFKRCPTCVESKPLADFPPNRAKRDGHQDHCRPCYQAYQHRWRQAHQGEYVGYMRAYYQEHQAELANKHRLYDQTHWPQVLARKTRLTRAYRATDPERTRLLQHVSNVVRWAKRTGRLVPATACEDCGTTTRRITAAHSDYSQPLLVRWLCYSCHSRWDAAEPKLGNWRTG